MLQSCFRQRRPIHPGVRLRYELFLVEQLLLDRGILSTTASSQAIGASLPLTLLRFRKGRFPLCLSLPGAGYPSWASRSPVCSSFVSTPAILAAGSISIAIVSAMGPLVVAPAFFHILLVKGLAVGIVVKSLQLPEARLTGGEGFMLLALACWTRYSIAARKRLDGFIAACTIVPGSFLLVVLTLLARLSGFSGRPRATRPVDDPRTVPVATGNLISHAKASKLAVSPMALWADLVPVAAILHAM